MGLSRQASDCDSTIQLVRVPYPEEEKRAWSCHSFPATVSKHGIKGRLPLHPGRRPSRRREHTEIRSTGTVATPAPSDRRMSPPSPRLSRSCTTPRAVQLGRGLYTAASCRRPSGWREPTEIKAPARLGRLRPLAGVFPDRLPGCPEAVPRPERPRWAVGL